MTEKKTKQKIEKKVEIKTSGECHDEKCPFHGSLSVRGRTFKGIVIKKFPKRIVITLERTIYLQKYERYTKSKTKLHARLPDCLESKVKVGDYVEIGECRKLSKIISFVVTKKLKSKEEMENVKVNQVEEMK